MKIITDLSNFTADRGTVVTIGTFDGVHCGHQKIIKRLTEAAKAEGLLSTVFTFFPHPRMIVQHDTQLRLLHTLAEKQTLLAALGVDLLIVQPFDKKFSQMSAEEFVEELLVKHLRVQKVIIGYDHRFGKNRTADIRDMHRFGEHYGFAVEEISAQEVDEVSVSSTKVREALLSGQVEKAESYLGVPYSLTGKVVHGQKLGRTLGYPTANIQVEEDYKLIPADGVYVVYSLLEGRKVYGMMSIGKNPTIADKGSSIEVHFLDYDGDLYDKSLTVYFIKYLRAEQKFASVAALQQQIEQDEEQSRKAIALR
ncbi:riboflavin kinase / FMN adenylyltransferase [Capnocytophaga haemolytica]|uniref:Riboflavin biosynthesis protein n=1 Tax=Capnocytophaga haemolytica TaxID=45243 RepID=A0AAX2GWU6_9FLAO|nr:bifunctional riboflavin kinase/FAD synthetase [Capnocytophaga haemolytica]AMD85216.1 bifunctional riboflavin kinase/FMN adenylyltransferase [Capnocytophaga haemolytica]SFN64343.1 riboflavin kinase / FMN adenylyltransferase [Capnocytophaga haemolytica]SNV04101.1 Riboflavin biosynthesis protein ribF [Capnocytophaga haemolytica]